MHHLDMGMIVADAETQLPSLLDHVERGESVVITRHGKVVARIVPDAGDGVSEIRKTIAAIEAFRKTMPRLTLDEILSARHEGHRY